LTVTLDCDACSREHPKAIRRLARTPPCAIPFTRIKGKITLISRQLSAFLKIAGKITAVYHGFFSMKGFSRIRGKNSL